MLTSDEILDKLEKLTDKLVDFWIKYWLYFMMILGAVVLTVIIYGCHSFYVFINTPAPPTPPDPIHENVFSLRIE